MSSGETTPQQHHLTLASLAIPRWLPLFSPSSLIPTPGRCFFQAVRFSATIAEPKESLGSAGIPSPTTHTEKPTQEKRAAQIGGHDGPPPLIYLHSDHTFLFLLLPSHILPHAILPHRTSPPTRWTNPSPLSPRRWTSSSHRRPNQAGPRRTPGRNVMDRPPRAVALISQPAAAAPYLAIPASQHSKNGPSKKQTMAGP